MNDFTPQPDRALKGLANSQRSLEDLKQILLQDFSDDDIRVSLVEIAIAELKVSRYFLDGDRAPLMHPTVSLQTALNELGVKFDGN
ncbi:MAG TPA: hypothetical protein DCZ88_09150 [Pseudanabaena sp.]|nr:hypothetical protein [Pseudanabaena sp.]